MNKTEYNRITGLGFVDIKNDCAIIDEGWLIGTIAEEVINLQGTNKIDIIKPITTLSDIECTLIVKGIVDYVGWATVNISTICLTDNDIKEYDFDYGCDLERKIADEINELNK